MTPKTKLDWALYWASRGIPVLPVVPGTKRPYVASGKGTGHGKASLEEGQLREWWARWPDADIGGIPGHAEPPLFVVDEDPRHGGDVSMTDLEIEHGTLPSTLEISTPSGGRHRWFRGSALSSASRVAPGIDIRGWGGIAILPSSSGSERYGVVVNAEPATPPDWLVGLCGKPEGDKKEASADELDIPVNIERATLFLKDAEVAVEGHGGNTKTFETACWIRDFGISEDVALELMLEHWNDRCEPAWEEDELAQIVENAYSYGENDAGCRALEPAEHAFANLRGEENVEKNGPHGSGNRPRENSSAGTNRFQLRGEAEQDRREDPRWIIPGWLPENSVAMLYGHSGSYKSFVALELALSLAANRDVYNLGRDDSASPQSVIYLAGEGLVGIEKYRRPAWRAARGLLRGERGEYPTPGSDGGSGSHDRHGSGVLPFYTSGDFPVLKRGTNEVDELVDAIRSQEVSPRLVVVDTLAQLMAGMNENAAEDATYAMFQLGRLQRAFPGSCVLFIHHSGKDKSQGARGSSAIEAAVDVAIKCDADPATKTLRLRAGPHPHGKMKDAEPPKPLYLRGTRSLRSLVFDPISRAEFHRLRQEAQKVDPDEIRHVLENLGEPVSTNVLAIETIDADDEEDIKKREQELRKAALNDGPLSHLYNPNSRRWSVK